MLHPTYMCIIYVLDAQHPCVKNPNLWKNDFHMISIIKLWDGKFVMLANKGKFIFENKISHNMGVSSF
jgi:hypothetical protein